MVTPPKARLEIVLLADQSAPIHLWLQSTAELARRFEYDKQRSTRILGGAALFLVLMLYLFPALVVIPVLVSVMVLFPLTLVGRLFPRDIGEVLPLFGAAAAATSSCRSARGIQNSRHKTNGSIFNGFRVSS
jgi:hypothetical protein